MRSSSALALLVAFGCGTADPPAESETTAEAEPLASDVMAPVEAAPRVDPEHEARVQALADWLSGCAVADDAFVRHKLYTWTRADQLDDLRGRRPRLLSRERSASGEQSLFDQAIADDEHPIARHLRRSGNRTRRFAWVTPWATRLGWEGGDYGDRLIEVTLRDDVWTARFDPEGEPRWRVVDAEGEAVPEARVRRSPARIAAVYHLGRGPRPFREVVLVNEQQIERWAYASDAVRERVTSDATRLRGLAALFADDTPAPADDFDAWLRAGWSAALSDPPLVERYRACLALANPAYTPTAEHLSALAATLEAMPEDEAIEHTVRRTRTRRRSAVTPSHAPGVFCDPTMGCVGPNGQWVRGP